MKKILKHLGLLLFGAISFSFFYACSNDDSSQLNDIDKSDLILIKTNTSDPINYRAQNFTDINNDFTFNTSSETTEFSFSEYQNIYNSTTAIYEVENDLIISSIFAFVNSDGGTGGCGFYFTYDTDSRISEITGGGDCGFGGHYVLQYNTNSIVFLDQIGNKDINVGFDGENRVASIEKTTNSFLIEYEGDNLKSILDNFGHKVDYTFDTKRNPFQTATFSNLQMIDTFIAIVKKFNRSPKTIGLLTNANNIIKVSYTNPKSWEEPQSYTYSYNKDDYPIKKVVGANLGSVEFTYLE